MSSQELNKLSGGKLPKSWGRWTDRDVYFLKKLFQVLTYKEIAELFEISESEIRGALSYRAKSKKTSKIIWDDEKILFLKDYYGKVQIDNLAQALGCSVSALHHKASRLGIKPLYETTQSDAMKEQQWRQIEDFPNYLVSDKGYVKNSTNNRILTPVLKNHYFTVRLSSNGKVSSKSVHRLIAQAFLGDIKNKEVNHIDGNPQNNNLDNLEVLDSEAHKIHTRLLRKYVGQDVNTSVLTPDKVNEMRKLHAEGNITYSELSKMYSISRSAARRAVIGETWNHLVDSNES